MRKPQPDPKSLEILDYIRTFPYVGTYRQGSGIAPTKAEIAIAVGIDQRDVEKHLGHLVDLGLIKPVSRTSIEVTS